MVFFLVACDFYILGERMLRHLCPYNDKRYGIENDRDVFQ